MPLGNAYTRDCGCKLDNMFKCMHHMVLTSITGSDDFILISNTTTWSDAQSYCREHYTDLASMRNQTENQRVQNLLTPGSGAWIGLFRDGWKWSDGSNSTFTFWTSSFGGSPNNWNGNQENCGEVWILDGGRWNDDICSTSASFFCYTCKL